MRELIILSILVLLGWLVGIIIGLAVMYWMNYKAELDKILNLWEEKK
jgi:hypothetical protein